MLVTREIDGDCKASHEALVYGTGVHLTGHKRRKKASIGMLLTIDRLKPLAPRPER